MFFHVQIETTEKVGKGGRNKEYFEIDKADLSEIKARVIAPYLQKEEFQFDGYFLKPSEIKRIAVKQTDQLAHVLADIQARELASRGIFGFTSAESIIKSKDYAKDITTQVFDELRAGLPYKSPVKSAVEADLSKVFIVHGRDDHAKVEAARFIERLGLKAIILHEMPSGGKTIIEKIEDYSNVGFAVVLYTPCDVGGLKDDKIQRPRPRQNVVFEHGYLIAKLGRNNVCALVKGDVEKPNDISGVVYVEMDNKGAWHIDLAKELKAAGYAIDMNKVI